jgi:hypothetical protein
VYVSLAYGSLPALFEAIVVMLNTDNCPMPPMHTSTSSTSSPEEEPHQSTQITHHLLKESFDRHHFNPSADWSSSALLLSSSAAIKCIELIRLLRNLSIFITSAQLTDSAITTNIASKLQQRVGMKLEKAIAAASSLFADSSSPTESVDSSDMPVRESGANGEPKSNNKSFEGIMSRQFSMSTKAQTLLASLSSLEESLNQPAVLPPHLQFSFNADIIEISRMRTITADVKWESKASGIRGKVDDAAHAADNGLSIQDDTIMLASQDMLSKQRRAEITFKLSILLRDRPSQTFLESRKILLPRGYFARAIIRVEIVGIEKIIISGGQNRMIYTISVFQSFTKTCPHHDLHLLEQKEGEPFVPNATENSCTCRYWQIKRRYTDFEELHKHLKHHIGTHAYLTLKLPEKKFINVVQSTHFLGKRMKGLQKYLHDVLVFIPSSLEVI